MSAEKKSERRRYDRIERRDEILVKEFSYPEKGKYKSARIIDISGGGLQIETSLYYPEKTVLKIEMNFTGWQRYTRGFLKYFGSAATIPLIVLAEVIRCKTLIAGKKYEVALIFTGIDETQREALIRFIRNEIVKKPKGDSAKR